MSKFFGKLSTFRKAKSAEPSEQPSSSGTVGKDRSNRSSRFSLHLKSPKKTESASRSETPSRDGKDVAGLPDTTDIFPCWRPGYEWHRNDISEVAIESIGEQSEINLLDVRASGTASRSTTPRPKPSHLDSLEKGDSYGVKILYCPSSPKLDIVFVHGLTGNAYSTWLHKKSGIHWPRDLLKTDINDARIATFGYDADVVKFWGQAAHDGVSGYASDLLGSLAGLRTQNAENRRIIFIAHSLGGLVVQKLLAISRASSFANLRSIEASTVGIVFLGTPHQGSDHARWGSSLASIVNIMKPANQEIIKLLKAGSQKLAEVQSGFQKILQERKDAGSKINIVCFYEQLPLFRSLIVQKESAIIQGEPAYPVHANHKDMTRFSSIEEKGYKDIIREIQWMNSRSEFTNDTPSNDSVIHSGQVKALDLHAGVNVSGLDSATTYHYLPLSRNRKFVGRTEQIELLERELLIQNSCQKLAVVGLGGTGKTQIALEFAYRVKDKYPNFSIFWIPAISYESFEQAFLDIAHALGLPTQGNRVYVKEAVKEFLSTKFTGKWLLVVDNVDDTSVLNGPTADQADSLLNYLPSSANGQLVFTTRYQEIAMSLADNDIIEVGNMDQNVALELLNKSLPRNLSLDDDQIAIELLRELTFLPLAITQASAYIGRNKTTISKYLSLLRNTEEDMLQLLSRDFQDPTRYKESKNPVATTWLVSFEQIRKNEPEAADYLSFMSCLEPKLIPHSILPKLHPEERMTHAIGTLCAYSFVIARDDHKYYDIHRLVHLAMKNWLRIRNLTIPWTKEVIERVLDVFPRAEHANRFTWRAYLPHIQKILSNSLCDDFAERYNLYEVAGYCLYLDGRHTMAEEWLERAYNWRRYTLKLDSIQSLGSPDWLASLYRENGNSGKAISLLEELLQSETQLPQASSRRFILQYTLAEAYIGNGQTEKGVELLEHTILTDKSLAEDAPDRLKAEHVLARTYLDNRRVEQAIKILEHVTEAEERQLEEDDPDRLRSQVELARAYIEDRQTKRAIEILEHATTIRSNLEETDTEQLASQHELARAYLADGQAHNAIRVLEKVVRIEEHMYDEHDRNRVLSVELLDTARRVFNDGHS